MPQTAKKWFPGHYIMCTPDVTYSPSLPSSDRKAWDRLAGPNGDLFAGLKQYIAWRRLEPTLGTFDWTPIHSLLDSLPLGKKAIICLQTQGWNEAIVPVACPADMVGNPVYDGGHRVKVTAAGTTSNATIHMASTMDRYLSMVDAFATVFDTDERIALVTTTEIPYDNDYVVRPPTGQYTDDGFRAQLYKLAQQFPAMFPVTVTGSLGSWWKPAASAAGVAADRAQYADYWLNGKAGFGGPDLWAPTHPMYSAHNFRTQIDAYSGQWPVFYGFEYAGLKVGPDSKDYGSLPWPQAQLDAAVAMGVNFIWWNTNERQNSFPVQPDGTGGRGFDGHAIPFLRANPGYGIVTAIPTNLQLPASGMGRMGKFGQVARANIDFIGGVDDASVQRFGSL